MRKLQLAVSMFSNKALGANGSGLRGKMGSLPTRVRARRRSRLREADPSQIAPLGGAQGGVEKKRLPLTKN